MKTNMYVWVAFLATFLFASCSKETNSPEPQPGEKTARLELMIEGTKAVNGRATDSTLPTTDEGNIKTIAVGVFNADGSVNVIAEPAIGQDNALAGINCTPGTVSIVVVANAPAGTFAGVMSKDDFVAKTIALKGTTNADKDGNNATLQLSNNLPMSGEANGVLLEAGKNKTQSIALSRLVARISISSIKTAFDANGSYAAATFKLDTIFLYNAMSTSTVTPSLTPQPTGTEPIHGGAVKNKKLEVENAWLLNVITPVNITSTAYTTPYWFYTFSNDGKSAAKTKLVIAGKFDADGTGTASKPEMVYYPIVVNKAQTGTIIDGGADSDRGNSTIKRNSDYKLSAIIKGKGVDDPATDIDPATLTLTVSVAPWALTITQEVTFE